MKTSYRFTRMFLAFILIFLCSFSPTENVHSQKEGTVLSLTPASGCSELSFVVRVENVVDLYAYSIQLSFDPENVEILEVTNGGFLDPGFYEPFNGFNNTQGTISFGMTQVSPSQPKTGSGNLILIRLQLTTPGSIVPFTFGPDSSLVNWPEALPVPFTLGNTSVFTPTCIYLPIIRK